MFRDTRLRKSTITLISFLALGVVFGSGCAPTGGPASPTHTAALQPADTPQPRDTPEPTNTPVPTNTATPAPTDTPEPTHTNTPDSSATAAYLSTQAAEAVLPEIDGNLQMAGLSTDTGSLLWVQDGIVPLSLNSFGEILYSPFEGDPEGSDFALYTEIAWVSSSGLAGCGLIFRSEPDFEAGPQYILETLRLSGLPAWDIIYFENGAIEKNVTGDLATGAIDQDQGATNKLLLIAEEEKFTVFVNDRRIGSYFDYVTSRLDGLFAFLAYQESGETTCTFDNSWVWSLR